MSQVLKFAPLQSRIDSSFWSTLSDKKLDQYQLSEAPVPLTGTYGPSRYAVVGSQLVLDGSSFGPGSESRQGSHEVPGMAVNLNIWDAFRDADQAALLKQEAARVWEAMQSGAALRSPALLSRFLLLCYADLKLFHYHYWFALPALKPPSPLQAAGAPTTLLAALGEQAATNVAHACGLWLRPGSGGAPEQPVACASPSGGPAPFWLVIPPGDTGSSGSGSGSEQGSAWASGPCSCVPLSDWEQHVGAGQQQQGGDGGATASASFLLAASDPSSLEAFPGWPLRNLLLMVAVKMGLRRVQVLCVRESSSGRVDPARCLLLTVELPAIPDGWCSGSVPDAVGWEANAEGRLVPRKVDLSPLMDPTLLSEQAVGLNLRLMKWRAAPELDIARIAATKCLLIGAGTLGCAVARCLLAWGVRSLTLADSGRVAYSNPVRQWLFEASDCAGGGRPKAQAAADALRRVFPSVEAQARELSVPMPGHPPANAVQEEAQCKAHSELAELVSSHDVVFLLTDTRESRWLPSLLAAAHGKLAVTAAVGFDSWVVMRHGAPPGGSNGKARLGCYFCNDVVGPLNSTHNRTLDQQCTVARPGLAPVASALAVELVAALLQHPLGVAAPPGPDPSSTQGPQQQQQQAEDQEQPALGPVPHMIRGQLSGFSQVCMVGHASSQCTACSAAVVDCYQQRGWPFVLEAIKDPAVLERVSGLAALHQGVDALLADEGEGLGAGEEEGEEGGKGGAGAKEQAGKEQAEEGGGGDGDEWCEV